MHVITANRLLDGEVVWLAANGQWVETLDGAVVIEAKEELDNRLDQATQSVADRDVVEVDPIVVALEDGAIVPVRLRERIRALGPTVRTDLGKQARLDESRSAA